VLGHDPRVSKATTAGSVALTQGVRVTVESTYLEHQSSPSSGRFVFAYTIVITNEGERTVQLKTRHWIITDATGEVREVRGEGVIGEQPRLERGQSFKYTSGCILKTQWGTMHGTYQMERDGGVTFDAEIAPFLLAHPSVGAMSVLN
jgi:ApaG protein